MDDKWISFLKNMGYSDKAIDLIVRKVNIGDMDMPSGSAQYKGTCGDVMILYLDIAADRIRRASYEYVGCAGLQSAGSALTEMVTGISLAEAEKLQAQDIIQYLEKIPPQKYECAEIAKNALQLAIQSYRNCSGRQSNF